MTTEENPAAESPAEENTAAEDTAAEDTAAEDTAAEDSAAEDSAEETAEPAEAPEEPAAAKKKTKKKAARKTAVDTSSLVLDQKLVSDTAEVVERRNRVEQLLESAEQGKDKVKKEIYTRVTKDYRVQLDEIAKEYAPLREQVIGELQRIREEESELRHDLAKLNEYLEEIRFRCQVGEFGEDELARLEEEKESPGHELETKLNAVERTFKTAEDLLGEDVEAAISGEGEPEPEPEPGPEAAAADDAPVPDGTVMMSTSELPSVPDGPVPDGTVMMGEGDLPAVPDGPVPDGTVMMGTGDMPAVPDGPVPDGTVMMSESGMPPVPDGPVPDGTVMMSSESSGETDNMPRALLTRTKPEGEKVFVIDLEELTLGRSTTNDVVIEGASVSRRHATIKYEDGAYVIRDHSSGGGVLVNGERQTELALSTGDEITIGSSVFSFEGP